MLSLGPNHYRYNHPHDAPPLDPATTYYLFHVEFKPDRASSATNEHWGLILYPAKEVDVGRYGNVYYTGEGRLHHIIYAPDRPEGSVEPPNYDLQHDVVERVVLRPTATGRYRAQTFVAKIPGEVGWLKE